MELYTAATANTREKRVRGSSSHGGHIIFRYTSANCRAHVGTLYAIDMQSTHGRHAIFTHATFTHCMCAFAWYAGGLINNLQNAVLCWTIVVNYARWF